VKSLSPLQFAAIDSARNADEEKRVFRLTRLLYRCYLLISFGLAHIAVLPFIALGFISDYLKGEITNVSLILSRIPFHFGESLRSLYYEALLISVGRDVTFKYGAFCQYRNTRFGNRVLVGYFNTIGEADIGDNVLIGGNVNVLSGLEQHGFSDPNRLIWDTPGKGRKMVVIGSDVWIGSNAIVGDDIGNRCVIATGAVVVSKIESHSLAGGNPARIIKNI
jgi:acetyltransferase-like isoleucine patch superfamily enzyme